MQHQNRSRPHAHAHDDHAHDHDRLRRFVYSTPQGHRHMYWFSAIIAASSVLAISIAIPIELMFRRAASTNHTYNVFVTSHG